MGLLLPVQGPARVALVAVGTGPGSWRWPIKWADTLAGQTVMWCGERRRVIELPVNAAAWALAARLGCPDLAERIGLNGYLLLTGANAPGNPADVPLPVIEAAVGTGLLRPSDAAATAGKPTRVSTGALRQSQP